MYKKITFDLEKGEKIMSNLGGYQWMTTTAKKLGGVENFVLAIATVGATVGVTIYESGKWCVKKLYSKKAKKQNALESKIYTIKSPGRSNNEVEFMVDDRFRIIETDGEAVLIEKMNDQNNPYFVSAELIQNISDYKE